MSAAGCLWQYALNTMPGVGNLQHDAHDMTSAARHPHHDTCGRRPATRGPQHDICSRAPVTQHLQQGTRNTTSAAGRLWHDARDTTPAPRHLRTPATQHLQQGTCDSPPATQCLRPDTRETMYRHPLLATRDMMSCPPRPPFGGTDGTERHRTRPRARDLHSRRSNLNSNKTPTARRLPKTPPGTRPQQDAHRKTPAVRSLGQDAHRKIPTARPLPQDAHRKTPAARCVQQDLCDQTSATLASSMPVARGLQPRCLQLGTNSTLVAGHPLQYAGAAQDGCSQQDILLFWI
ncbi:hypothetical protein K438DRAFT_1759173 [Mycena galopus ATCC 62051]|nr:hypothetical protein K438DRAFT_1759173 [Mycena galopus ATCC 62051]